MSGEKPTILIIDDDADFREIIVTKLTKEGFNVIEAENGEKGMEKARETRPDVILMDVKMPGGSGMETLAKMKADKELAGLKVFFLTNLGGGPSADNESDKFAKDVGALGYIRKTDNLDKIVDKVKYALSITM